ncbi:MAG TPA: GNAT family N-acetyltransferase [Polyangia bacterium]
METRRIAAAEVDIAHAILADCGRALAAAGYHNWDPPYPLERMRAEATSRQIYIVTDGGAPIATYTITTTMPHPYPPAIFAPDVPALYLNRLAVIPARWRGGLGRICMDDVEARARAAGCRAVRFDAFRDNHGILDFYRRLGYVDRGPFVVEKIIPVVCMEKELAPC